jgi:ubiquinone/menaquinone biosynthesis C-methylase UbiE
MNMLSSLLTFPYPRLSRLLVSHVKPFLTEKDTVLDIGSGNGYVAKQVIDDVGCNVTCIDIIDIHAVGPKPIIYDGNILPFPDKSFSTSFIFFCLHHTDHKESLLQEAKRVTKSKIIVMEDYSENLYDYTLNAWHRFISLIKFHSAYIQYFNDSELKKLFRKLGLTVTHAENIPPSVNPTHPTRKIMYVLRPVG